MLLIFSGCSGVGKNTVINELLSQNENLTLLPTYTTRGKREGEREGFPYHYLTTEAFQQKIEDREFYEYEQIHQNFYGTSRRLVADARESGRNLLKDIDVKGAMNLKRLLKDDLKVVTLFMFVDSPDVLVQRLTERGETEIELRLKRYDLEMEMLPKYEFAVNNDVLPDTVETVRRLIVFQTEGKGELTLKVPFSQISEERIAKLTEELRDKEYAKPISVKAGRTIFYPETAEDAMRYAAARRAGVNITCLLTLAPDAIDEESFDAEDDAAYQRLCVSQK